MHWPARLATTLRAATWRRTAVLAPVAMATLLVAALGTEAVRSATERQRVIDRTLHDYAAYAAWQYARRASDFIRLQVMSTNAAVAARGNPTTPGRIPTCRTDRGEAPCPAPFRVDGSFRGPIAASRTDGWTNSTTIPTVALQAFAERTERGPGNYTTSIGMGLVDGPGGTQLAAYSIDGSLPVDQIIGFVVNADDLAAVLRHVASFAPLLPPRLTGVAPLNTLVGLRVRLPNGALIASIGDSVTAGFVASDTIGPDLAALVVSVTLRPELAARLVSGGIPPANAGWLIGVLMVTVLVLVIAVLQVRRWDELLRLRSDFVTSVSHELRTPLAQISLFADTMLTGEDWSASDRHRFLGIISREASRLRQLVDSVLHFADMNRRTAPPLLERATPAHEIAAALEAFTPLARARGVAFAVDLDPAIAVMLDRDGFRQMLLNLLDNAVKFGPEGQHVVITLARDGASAVLRIDDEGPGVPPAERQDVLRPFVRLPATAHTAGSGIGLAVVQDIVTTHRGSLDITTSPAGGARITITLPLAPGLPSGDAH